MLDVISPHRIAAGFAVAALANLAGSYLAFRKGGIEGAYFSRDVAATAYANSLDEWWYPWLGYALLGACVAFVICALVVALLARQAGRRPSQDSASDAWPSGGTTG